MSFPRPEPRWSYGNLIATAASLLTCVALVWSGVSRVASADIATAAVPQLQQRVAAVETAQQLLNQDVQMLKQRREEDVQAMQGMRGEIINRLDRIEGKLDLKADKDERWKR